MKKMIRVFSCLVMLTGLLLSATNQSNAQTYRCDLKNINYPTPNTLEFDIWLENTGSNVYLLQILQMGIEFNYDGMANGGVITGSFVSGSNTLPAPQNNLTTNTSVNATSKQFRVTASIQTSSANAVAITSTPLKYGTFRLTNTQPFAIGAAPNFIWSFLTSSNRTKTLVSCWTNGATSGASVTTQTDGGTPNANNLLAPYNYIAGPQHYVENNLAVPQTCPTITAGTVTDPACYGGTGSLQVNMSNQAVGTYSVDGGTAQSFVQSTSFTVSGLSQGSHTIEVTPTGCTSTTLNVTIGGPTTPLTNTTTTTACDSYTWAVTSQSYTQTGTYTGTSINGQGCTVNETLNLTINQSTSNTTTASACGSYTWLVTGLTYTQSGSYTSTSVNAAGCTHTEILSLTINSLPTITTNATPSTIEYGASSTLSATGGTNYLWMPGNLSGSPVVSPLTTTTYTVTVTNSNGCINTATQTVVVNPPTYRCDVKNIIYTSPNTMEFDIWLENIGSNTYLLQTLQVGLEFNYAGLANGGVITGSFVPGSNALPAPQNNLATNTSVNATSKQFRITASIQTSSSSAAAITSTPLKYGTFRLTNTQPFTLGATPNFIWSFLTSSNRTKTFLSCWTNGAATGASVTTQTDGGTPNANFPTSPYNYIAGPQHYIENNPPVPQTCPIVTTGTITDPLCFGGTGSVQINLSNLAIGSYAIDGGSSISFTQTTSLTLNGLTQGNHTIVVTPTGCTATTLSFAIGGPTSGLTNSSTITTCDSYLWTVTGATYTQSGTYTGTSVNGQGCSVAETLILTINNSTSNTTSATACDAYTWTVNATTYTQSGTYTSTSMNAAGCTHTEILNLTINQSTSNTAVVNACIDYTWSVNNTNYTQSGIYTMNSINAAGCAHADTLVLSIYQIPLVTTNATPGVIYVGGLSTLTATGGTSSVWMPGNLNGSPIVSPATTTTYTVTVSNAGGCTATATQTVDVNTNTYRCDLKNITYPTPYTCEFDIWLENTGINTYLLQSLQMGIEFNYSGMANTGTITAAFVPGSNTLAAPQNNLTVNTSLNATSKQIRMTANIQPSAANATAITSSGVKYGTFRLTCTTPLTVGATPNFIWSFINASNRTKTGLTCWKNGSPVGSAITTQTTGGTPNASAPTDPFNYIGGPQHYVENNPPVPCVVTTLGTITDPLCFGGVGSAIINLSYATSGTYSVDGGANQTFSSVSSIVLSNLSQGSHTINITPVGCTSSTLTFSIAGPSAPLTNTTTISACGSYTWAVNGNTYNATGIYSGTSINAQGCIVNETLDLTIYPNASISGLNASYFVNDAPVTMIGTPSGGVFSGPGVSAAIFDPSQAGVGTHTITYTPAASCSPVSVTVIVLPLEAEVPVKVFLQGYYLGSGVMQSTLSNQGLPNPLTDCDDVNIELHDATFPYATAHIYAGILQTDGSILCTFPASAIGNSYYLAVVQRNHIQTWSANPILISSVTPLYDFTLAANQAYADNQIEVETGIYALYAGDVNQDFSIDVFDYLDMDPDIVNGNFGYLSTDVNGDGVVDVFDALITLQNITDGIGAALP